MFELQYFLRIFVQYLFDALQLAIVARALLSWFVRPGSGGWAARLMVILEEITEPIIAPIRRIMPRVGMLDLSPMIALFLLWILRDLLVGAMRGY